MLRSVLTLVPDLLLHVALIIYDFWCSHFLDITATFRGYPFKKIIFMQNLDLAKIHGKCVWEIFAVEICETNFKV